VSHRILQICRVAEALRDTNRGNFSGVMPALVAGIHVFLSQSIKNVDGRDKPDKPGHDCVASQHQLPLV
jgi:hypothetical protein